MTREALYDLAFSYKKTKLWKRLLDTQIFAARTEKNETIFICIMGILGQHISVAVYPENEFYSYYKFLDTDPFSDDRMTPDHFEQYIQSSCIQCSFENKDMMDPLELEEARAYARSHGIRLGGANAYPQFTRFIPYHAPWHVTEEADLDLLAEGLEASMALYEKLETDPGFAGQLRRIDYGDVHEVPVLVRTGQGYVPDGTVPLPGRREDSFPAGQFDNEVLLQKIRKKKQDGIIDCRVTWMNNPIQENPEVVPYYPVILMAVEESEGAVLSLSITNNYESCHDELLLQFMNDLAERKKRPAKVLAQNGRTFALLEDAMKKISVDLELKADLPDLDAALFSLYDHLSEGGANHAGSSLTDPESDSQAVEGLHRMLDEIESMDDELMLFVPEEITSALAELSKNPRVPSSMKDRLDSLLQRVDRVRQESFAESSAKSGRGGKKAGGSQKKAGGRKKKAEEPLSYVISVSPYSGCYRHIRVSADITLDDFHEIIQDVFDFYNDHLYAFFMDNRAWSFWDAYFCPGDGEGRLTSDYRLRDLSLYKGKKFLYLFDYGDEWRFECRVLREEAGSTDGYQILRSKGDAPEQYPDYDDEDDDEDPDW